MKHAHRWIRTLVALALLLGALPAYAADGGGVVNVNDAGTDELALLPRIGPAIAQRIVDFREENGPFKAKEDLMLVRGIGEKTFELLESYVTLEGETTLSEKVRVSRQSSSDR
jgi:competence protein ComEA